MVNCTLKNRVIYILSHRYEMYTKFFISTYRVKLIKSI